MFLCCLQGTGLLQTVNKVVSNSEHSQVGLVVNIPNKVCCQERSKMRKNFSFSFFFCSGPAKRSSMCWNSRTTWMIASMQCRKRPEKVTVLLLVGSKCNIECFRTLFVSSEGAFAQLSRWFDHALSAAQSEDDVTLFFSLLLMCVLSFSLSKRFLEQIWPKLC